MKIRSATGSKSIARVAYEIEAGNHVSESTEGSTSDSVSQLELDEPLYIQLWMKTKRHKCGTLDDEAEMVLDKLWELHSKMVEENGDDNLTVEEAYEMVLGHSSGHARGLGGGHPIPSKKGCVGQEAREREKVLRAEIDRKEKEAREREQELRNEIEKKEQEARGREQELRAEAVEREKELRLEIEKKEKEAMEREAKMKADMKAEMMEMFRKFSGGA